MMASGISNRSVSPVIAIILLIGISIAAVTLAYNWYINVQQTSGISSEEAIVGFGNSSLANLQLLSAEQNSHMIMIRNIGGVTVVNVTVLINNRPVTNGTGFVPVERGNSTKIHLWNYSQGPPVNFYVMEKGDLVEVIGEPGGYIRQKVR